MPSVILIPITNTSSNLPNKHLLWHNDQRLIPTRTERSELMHEADNRYSQGQTVWKSEHMCSDPLTPRFSLKHLTWAQKMWWRQLPPRVTSIYTLIISPASAASHSSRWPSRIRLRVPCPLCWTSRIHTSGSRVWVRASRETPPSPRGTNRPWAPVTHRKQSASPVIRNISSINACNLDNRSPGPTPMYCRPLQ